MHIVLLIIKILGIALLALLVLFLLLAGLLLFLPFKYQGEGSYLEKIPRGKGKLSWLFGFLSIRFSYDKELTAAFRIGGIPVFRIPEKKGPVKKKKRKRQTQKAEEPESVPKILEENPDGGAPLEDPKEEARSEQDNSVPGETVSQGIFSRIKNRLRIFFRKLKKLAGLIRHVNEKRTRIVEFMEHTENRETMGFLIKTGKRLMKHVLPRRLKGQVTFGCEDPYTTGQLLTFLAFLYPIYGRNVSINPVFDGAFFETEGSFKGRIRLIHFLTAAVRVLLNRRVRSWIKRLMDR